MSRLGLFPGQGIPRADVITALASDSPLIDRASEILRFDLRRRVRQAGDPLPTTIAQPAILVASLVGWQRATAGGQSFDVLAGHSLGEYAALVAAEAISVDQALCAVVVRAHAMEKAAHKAPGGMVAAIGLDPETVAAIAHSAGAWVANDNGRAQLVISGPDDALEEAARAITRAKGRAVRLQVGGPFHTPLVAEAAYDLQGVLAHIWIRNPRTPVISNVTAAPYRSPGEIRALLVRQITEPVRFRESVEWAWRHKVRDIVDVGPGAVVGTLAERVLSDLAGRVGSEIA